jgi:hypothetical protein
MIYVQFIYIASLPGLTGRQNSNNVPTSCTSVCTILSGLQNSTDANQLCTASNSNSLQRCANCILLIGGNTLFNNDSLMSQTQRAVNGELRCILIFLLSDRGKNQPSYPLVMQRPSRYQPLPFPIRRLKPQRPLSPEPVQHQIQAIPVTDIACEEIKSSLASSHRDSLRSFFHYCRVDFFLIFYTMDFDSQVNMFKRSRHCQEEYRRHGKDGMSKKELIYPRNGFEGRERVQSSKPVHATRSLPVQPCFVEVLLPIFVCDQVR